MVEYVAVAAEQLMNVNGVELCVQTFGDRADPAILLIAGATCSMDWWDERLCQELADARRLVIRYDLRDTGRSTSSPAGSPDYSLEDLTDDAIALVQALQLRSCHLVGISMGGMIGQRFALRRPDLLASLTLIATTPGQPGDPDLPPVADRLQAYFTEQYPAPDWNDRHSVNDYLVRSQAIMSGPASFDEDWTRRISDQCFDRSISLAASQNHPLLLTAGSQRARLGEITLRTLIMHGTEDPLFPYGHAEALNAEIPGSTLVPLDGMGHQPPPSQVWDVVVPAILRHTRGDWGDEADRLATRSLAADDVTGWFDQLYASGVAGTIELPWDRLGPHALLADWDAVTRARTGGKAIVVGCGLGADAEFLSGLGHRTTAFDVSDTALELARERFPASTVDYVRADLFQLPGEWLNAFDLVLDIFTVQALPPTVRTEATAAVASLVAPGGSLFVIFGVAEDDEPVSATPPWRLTRTDIEAFATHGLDTVRIERNHELPGAARWRAEFLRPAQR